MAADEWLLELHRNGEASARAREEARRRQDAQGEEDAISAGHDSHFSCSDSSDEMSVVVDDDPDDSPLADISTGLSWRFSSSIVVISAGAPGRLGAKGTRYSIQSSGALLMAPSKDSAVRRPEPFIMMVMELAEV